MKGRSEPNTNGIESEASKHRSPRGLSPSTMGGALFGGVMGAALGPVGALAGVIIGGLAGEVVERHSDARKPAKSELPV